MVGATQVQVQHVRMILRFRRIPEVSAVKIKRPMVRSDEIKKEPRHVLLLPCGAESGALWCLDAAHDKVRVFPPDEVGMIDFT